MNIVHLVSNKEWGGGERYALDLCIALRDAGHNVSVFTRKLPAVAGPFADAGLHAGFLHLGGALDIVTPIRLAKALDAASGPVILHVHNFKDAATALKARRLCRRGNDVRVVCTRHLVRPARTDSSHRGIYSALDAVIFVSQLARDTFISSLPSGFPSERFHVVPNAITTPPATVPFSRADGPLRIIYAGRIAREKGIETLLDALAILRESAWSAEICGTGNPNYTSQLEALARSLDPGRRITWAGHVTDVPAHIAAADVLVLPSIVPESFGLVVLEAFSQGVPVITTSNGAQREIVTDEVNGQLVPPGDSGALADALRGYIDNPLTCRKAGEMALKRAADFSYPQFFKRITDIYNGCTQAPQR